MEKGGFNMPKHVGGGASMSMMYWRSRADPKKNDDEVSTKERHIR